MPPISFVVPAVATLAWLLAGFLIRPYYRACAHCGFLYDFDGRRCGHCKKVIGLGRRLLAAALWPLHFLRRIRELRAMPPLHSMPGRIVPPGMSVVKAMAQAPLEREDEDLEKALLGAFIEDNRKIRDVGPDVPFSGAAHRKIFEAIRDLFRVSGRVDLVSLRDQLKRQGSLEEIGGARYLASLVESVPSPDHAAWYAAGIRARNAGQRMPDVLRAVLQDLEDAQDGPRILPGLSTGYDELDRLTGGLRRGGLYAVAGRPSMGTTGLALGMLEHVALGSGKPVLIFSPELSAEELAKRMLSSHAKLPFFRVRDGRLSEEEFSRLVMAAGAFHEATILIDDRADLDLDALRATARRRVREGVSLVVIDAAQLVQERSPWADLGRELKTLARELEVPLVITAPVNRKAESRAGHRAKPIDLRGVGSLDAAADVVMLLYRDEYYDPDSLLHGICEINLGRNRYGSSCLVELAFQKEWCRFEVRRGEK